MRVYFRGTVLAVVLVVMVALMVVHQHIRNRHQAMSKDSSKKSHARSKSSSAKRPTTLRQSRIPTTAGRQGAATSAARAQAAGKTHKKTVKLPASKSSQETAGGRALRAKPAKSERPSSGEAKKPPAETLPSDGQAEASARQIPSGGQVQMDIRTVDPLSATEPMVLRQQEELEQEEQGQKGQGQKGQGSQSKEHHPHSRPQPVVKKQDLSQSWLGDMEYPQWYTESVRRSRVYGKEKEFVGAAPLYDGPCPSADEVKAKYAADKVRTFSYVEGGSLIPGSKNPCWYEDPRHQRQIRCLPYFYVAGVAKCGTTDMHRRIRMHPDIVRGELKEYHWWDRLRYGAPMELKFMEEAERNDRPLPLAVYSRIVMGDEVEKLKTDLRTTGHSEIICGDGSPSYFWDPKQWGLFEGNEGCREPRLVVGSFIQHANPQSKIILLFRHPTQRLYSRFLSRTDRTRTFKGASPLMFHDYATKGVAAYKACFNQYSIRECTYNKTLYDEAVIRIIEGFYPVFMEDWLRIFRRDQILVLRNEDYSMDIEGHMLKVFDFLQVAPLSEADLSDVVGHHSMNVGSNYEKVGAMLPETIALLNEFYKPFVLRLHELLGDDRFLWKDIVVT